MRPTDHTPYTHLSRRSPLLHFLSDQTFDFKMSGCWLFCPRNHSDCLKNPQSYIQITYNTEQQCTGNHPRLSMVVLNFAWASYAHTVFSYVNVKKIVNCSFERTKWTIMCFNCSSTSKQWRYTSNAMVMVVFFVCLFVFDSQGMQDLIKCLIWIQCKVLWISVCQMCKWKVFENN